MYFCNYIRHWNYTIFRWYQTERPYNQQCQRVEPGTMVQSLQHYSCFFYCGFLLIEPSEVKLTKDFELAVYAYTTSPKERNEIYRLNFSAVETASSINRWLLWLDRGPPNRDFESLNQFHQSTYGVNLRIGPSVAILWRPLEFHTSDLPLHKYIHPCFVTWYVISKQIIYISN